MAGIYIHVPFCKQACSYCDFHFSTNQKLRKALIDALCMEISQRSSEVDSPPETLYLGGGSPSILSGDELQQVFHVLHANFDLSQLKEVTLESNPDDHSPEKLALWLSLGINRLSIGIQSFIDSDLQLMNRAHDAAHAIDCVIAARQAGFESLSIDLIYGIPGQSMRNWQANVQKALLLAPDHISAYCLTIEERTALHYKIQKQELHEKADDIIEKEYLSLHRNLLDAGYFHYEISNFCLPGREALHNSNYWSGKAYIGFGPAAHSFNGKCERRWNISNNPQYIKALQSGAVYSEMEELDVTDRANEWLMTGLRSAQGVNTSGWPAELKAALERNLNKLQPALRDKLIYQHGILTMLPEHWLITDSILKHLFLEKPKD